MDFKTSSAGPDENFCTSSQDFLKANGNNSSIEVIEPTVKFIRISDEAQISQTAEDTISELKTDETPMLHKDVVLAAALITDAKNGRHSDFQLNEKCVHSYLSYHHWGFKAMLYFFITLNHSLAIFEKPAVLGYELPYWVTMLMEVSCLIFYTIRLVHAHTFTKIEVFWKDAKNISVLLVIVLTVLDIVCYLALMKSDYFYLALRWSRILRPLLIVNFGENRQIRRAFRNIRKTLPDILNVLILFFLSITLFTLMAQKLFSKRLLKFPDGTPYFNDYFDIFFDLYVLVTTANNPDVMMPAYDESKYFALFFFIYLIICLYIFMNIILAVIYNNYRRHLKNEVKNAVKMKRENLSRAFDFIKVRLGNKFVLTYQRFVTVLEKVPPKRGQMMTRILWYVLDSDGNNEVEKTDFLKLADLLNVGVSEIKDRQTIFHRIIPNIYSCSVSNNFRLMVAHKYFRYFFDILIVVNAVLIALDINEAEWVFLAVFTLEILFKIYTFGFTSFIKKFWNMFDTIVIGTALIATTVQTVIGDSADGKARTLDVLLVLRVLRLVKIVGSIERFRVVVVTIMNLGPSILTYGGVLFVVYYVFAIIGMEIFSNKFQYFGYNNTSRPFCGTLKLKNSQFYENHYCSNNFNNIINSLVLLFELMVVNQWHILTQGFVLVTSKAARIYFFLFHLVCVMVVLNIFTAFVLEAFILEYSFSKGKSENAIEKKIIEMGLKLGRKTTSKSEKDDKQDLVDDSDFEVDSDQGVHNTPSGEEETGANKKQLKITQDSGIRFNLSKSKKVEDLLQRMFEDEIDDCDTSFE